MCEGDVNVVKKKVCNFTGSNGTNEFPAVFVYFIPLNNLLLPASTILPPESIYTITSHYQ